MKIIFRTCSLLFLMFILSFCNTNNATPPDSAYASERDYFYNPILQSGPDPQVFLKDGWYYYTQTSGGSKIIIRKTQKMTELKNAESVTIWRPPSSGMWSHSIWAPEIHFLKGKWYVYFAADDGENFNHRMYVLENSSDDPLTGEWILKGQVTPTTDRWAIDGSVFEHNGIIYFIWSGWEEYENVAQNIYIAKMENPWTIDGDRVLLSRPEFSWESVGANADEPKVNEGPTLLKGIDKLFLVYSASGCWTDDYCLGMLTVNANVDLLDPASWTKSTEPVLKTSVTDKVFAPGHNSFFKSLDGQEDWILFHANDNSGDGCGDLRKPRIQKVFWRTDGTPDFGRTISNETPVRKPSGE